MMKNIDTLWGTTTINGLMVAALALSGTLVASHSVAQCDATITGVITQPNCGMDDGIIELFISEGTEVYMVNWSNGEMGTFLTGLSPGYYSVTVIDWNMCETTAEFYLTCGEEEDDPGDVAPVETDCALTTFTQGGWGSPPNGNNPGAYLHANFAGAFPQGLTIGCTNSLHLTSAQAVTDHLPGGGPPAKLPAGTITDPRKFKNVLAAQLVAATLNVGMDAYDPDFESSTMPLGAMLIASGPFLGHTVQQLLDMANAFIGDCGGNGYTASQYNEALSAINENFVGGGMDNGFLSCATGGTRALMNGPTAEVVAVHPNPASSALYVMLDLDRAGTAQVEFIDVTGRVTFARSIAVQDGGTQDLRIDVSAMKEGVYFLRISGNGRTTVTRVVVAH